MDSQKKLNARRLSLTVNLDDCPGFVCSGPLVEGALVTFSATILHGISRATYVDVPELPDGSALSAPVDSSGSAKSPSF